MRSGATIRFRVPIAGLMVSVVAFAIGLAALRFASEVWAGFVGLLALGLLALAVLGVVYRRGRRRASWLGFALFGGAYAALAWGDWWGAAEVGPRSFKRAPPEPPALVTSLLLDRIRPALHRERGPVGMPNLLDRVLGSADARTRRIWAELDKPIAMPFASETPVEDVLKYINSATQGPGLPDGLPIYVDPMGLLEAEKSLLSPVTLEMEGVPLRVTLGLILKQLDLIYRVEDGVVFITYVGDDRSDPARDFRRVGHGLFVLLSACLGGLAGRLVYATRDPDGPPPATPQGD